MNSPTHGFGPDELIAHLKVTVRRLDDEKHHALANEGVALELLRTAISIIQLTSFKRARLKCLIDEFVVRAGDELAKLEQ